MGVEGRLVALQSLSTIENGTSLFNFQSLFFLAFFEVSTTTLFIKPYMPQRHNLQPYPQGTRGWFYPKRHYYMFFELFLTES